MTTTTRYIDTDGQPAMPGNYRITDTRVRVVAVTRPDGFTVADQHAVITHTLTPDNPATPENPDNPDASAAHEPTGASTVPAGPVVTPEQALADIRTAFDACFTPDFNGVDWRDDKAIQTLAATVYPILYRAETAQETTA